MCARFRPISSGIEAEAANREFTTVTGTYKGKRMSVVSTGIGTDNIDIVVNEIDALFNIDFGTRTVKEEKTSLTLVRLGTCGSITPDLRIGGFDSFPYFGRFRRTLELLPRPQ